MERELRPCDVDLMMEVDEAIKMDPDKWQLIKEAMTKLQPGDHVGAVTVDEAILTFLQLFIKAVDGERLLAAAQ